ncbi:hypothetical protein ACHAXT_004062 [Thalassiosira profunda]
MSIHCADCNAALDRGCLGLVPPRTASCAACQKTLCRLCAGDRALIPFEERARPPPVEKASIQSFCKPCFERKSVLDYGRTYDVVEPAAQTDGATPTATFLWVHGGGASRALFRPHAAALAQKGYRSVLIDLPGHGTLVETPLTLDTCVEVVERILDSECAGQTPVYVGGSLGAYIGFYILGKLKERFSGAILLDCGQNVGPDCSLKARLGIWFLRKLSGHMSNKSLMGAMMSTVKKSHADYHLVECSYGSGMFFQQGPAQCDCMHVVAPADIIPELQFPLLFFNGSKDYRDSEDQWLSLCKDGERSSLKVYEAGDHFFCHDTRFVDDMLDRMDKFVQAL